MAIGLGIFLIAVGAVLAFAVTTEPSGLDLDATGWILMAAGLFLVVLSLAWWSYRRSTGVVERETYPVAYPPPITYLPGTPAYPAAAPTVVERPIYPAPAVERIVETERPYNPPRPVDRVIQRDVYDEDFPP